jgi:hypothetical protein
MRKDDFISADSEFNLGKTVASPLYDRDFKVWGRMSSSLLTEIPRFGKG